MNHEKLLNSNIYEYYRGNLGILLSFSYLYSKLVTNLPNRSNFVCDRFTLSSEYCCIIKSHWNYYHKSTSYAVSSVRRELSFSNYRKMHNKSRVAQKRKLDLKPIFMVTQFDIMYPIPYAQTNDKQCLFVFVQWWW